MHKTVDIPKLVYIAHAYGLAPEVNGKRVIAWIRWAAIHMKVLPICPWYATVLALEDKNIEERKMGILINEVIISRCDELWLCGEFVTAGMQLERQYAREHGIKTLNFTGRTMPNWDEEVR